MSFNDSAIDKIELQFKKLTDDVNRTSAAARSGWIFFLSAQAYFFITMTGTTHQDLLLNTPVQVPILQVEIGLRSYFFFTPFIFVLIHMGILLQHVMLSRQARELHKRVSNFEGRGLFRSHPVRIHLHSYFFTQLIAGPKRSAFFALFLAVLGWLSFGILPIILLLNFQTTFLPFHDISLTWAHRAYLVADLLILLIFTVFMRHATHGFISGFGHMLIERPVSFFASFILGIGALMFSLAVATIPDERMDRLMTSIWPETISSQRDYLGEERRAFWPTAMLFEGPVDRISGRISSPFGRNLVLTDVDLVRDNEQDIDSRSINLRRRDLRYATLERLDLRQADLTGAVLFRASLRETNLSEIIAVQTVFRGADLQRAQFVPPENPGRPVRRVNLRGADLQNADLRQVDLSGSELKGAKLRGARMRPEDRALAERQGAEL